MTKIDGRYTRERCLEMAEFWQGMAYDTFHSIHEDIPEVIRQKLSAEEYRNARTWFSLAMSLSPEQT